MSMALWKTWKQMDQADISEAVIHGSGCLGISLKLEQSATVHSLLAGDVLVSLPTGYGKSVIFQVLPFCTSYLMSHVNPPVDASHIAVSTVVVVSPLISLMTDQVTMQTQ